MTATPFQPQIEAFFHKDTFTVAYLVWDAQTKQAAVIDSVLDFDFASGRTATIFADELMARIGELGLSLRYLLETHVHADHLSAAPYLKKQLGGEIVIGEHIKDVQGHFFKVFHANENEPQDGRQFDRLVADLDVLELGQGTIKVLHTPGHTPACVSYLIGGNIFVGDTIFMPDFGTARCDFPGGSAETLYQSVRKILSLPDETKIFVGHDYGAEGRDYAWETTVGEERRKNIHVQDGVAQQDFVKMRTERDATLSLPALIVPSVQVNMRAGHMPPAEENGVSYLKVPVNLF